MSKGFNMKTMQNRSFLSSRKNSGFTLIEFLVASALAMIVISAAGSTLFYPHANSAIAHKTPRYTTEFT